MIEGAFGSKNAFANTLSKSIPLLFTGLAVAFANKGGIFNIGGEGQLYAGAMASTVTALMMQGAPRFLVIFCSFCAGMLAGACVGAIIGAAKIKLQVNEVVVAIMLNYIIQYFYFVYCYISIEAGRCHDSADSGYWCELYVDETDSEDAIDDSIVSSGCSSDFFCFSFLKRQDQGIISGQWERISQQRRQRESR